MTKSQLIEESIKKWNKYANEHWQSSDFSGIHLLVQEDFGKEFLSDELSLIYDKAVEEGLKNSAVLCGKLMELPDKTFIGGCGEPVNILSAYACVDCSAPFHRKCLLKHMKEDMPVQSLSKMTLEKAFQKLDELSTLTPKGEK